jgi:hypothetical protein
LTTSPAPIDECLGLAYRNPVLAPVVDELFEAHFIAADEEGFWEKDGIPGDPTGHFGIRVEKQDGHRLLIVSVQNKAHTWGLSIAATLCGKDEGVCYWGKEGDKPNGFEDTWPGIDAALAKAKLLANGGMTIHDPEAAHAIAEGNKSLAPVLQEIYDSGKFLLSDGAQQWGYSKKDLPDDQLIGGFQVATFLKDGEAFHVVTVHGRKDTRWAFSVWATPAGDPRGVSYWDRLSPHGAPVEGQESEWPGLDAAVMKARLFMEVPQ